VPLKEVLTAAEEEDEEEAGPEGKPEKVTVGGQQGVLWFANIYPTKAFRFDARQMLTHHNHDTLIPKLLPEGVQVLRTVPREREGGVFVYFRAPPAFVLQVLRNLAPQDGEAAPQNVKRFLKKEDILSTVCKGISQYLKTHEIHAFLCPYPVRAHRVEGTPYLEDLQARYPTSRLRVRVEPAGASVSEEQLYAKLRKYGILDDIEVLPEGKGFVVAFRHIAGAVSARNCLHRAAFVPEAGAASADEGARARVRIDFEPFMQKWIRDFVKNNARFVIPLVVACMFGTTYFIWDPLRTVSVQLKIAACELHEDSDAASSAHGGGREAPNLHGAWGWVLRGLAGWNRAQSQLLALIPALRHGDGSGGLLRDFWKDRDEEVNELNEWLTQTQDQVQLLTGHRGNGQSAFVRQILRGRALYIDASEMLEAGGAVDDQIFLRRLCRSVGYWPAQGMDRMMTALLDLLLPGSGKLSRENEVIVAVQRVLSCITQALDAWRQLQCDESGVEGTVPIIVIDGFTSENKDRRDGFFESLVTWAAYVCEERLARVLFIADSSFAEPAILAALRDRPERLTVHELSDADVRSLPRIIQQHFERQGREAPHFTAADIAPVGGRFRDIAAVMAHVDKGHSVQDAVRRLVEAAETNVRTLLTLGQPGAKWSRPQLWRAVQLLASSGQEGVPYDVFLWSVFRGDEVALRSMKESNLITLAPRAEGELQPPAAGAEDRPAVGRTARRYKVFAGSPLFGEVFRRLVRHKGLAAVFDLEVAKEDIKRERATAEGYEAELVRLQEVDDVKHDKGRDIEDPNDALRKRKEQLLRLMLEQHDKLEKYHAARRKAMATIKRSNEEFLAAEKTSAPEAASQPPPASRGYWNLLKF